MKVLSLFDGMAFKTMLRQLISKWGVMSTEMQMAYSNDGAVIAPKMDDNAEKWEEEKKKRSEAGKKGMETRWKAKKGNNTTITPDNKGITKITDNVNVNGLSNNKLLDNKDISPTNDKKAVKRKYGSFQNVLLTDAEAEQLNSRFNNRQEKIEDLSYYLATHNVSYKSHYAAILSWDRSDKKKNTVTQQPYIPPGNGGSNKQANNNNNAWAEFLWEVNSGG